MRITTAVAALAALVLSAEPARASSICGDVNDSGALTASDALAVLKAAVGQAVELLCSSSGQLPRTGQTKCYSAAGAEILCDGTGQDGELQKGVARSFTDNGDGTITDNATGLMWEKLSLDETIHDVAHSYSWGEAFASKVATLNSTNFANHDDWRVPNILELESLRNLGVPNPATYSAFNTGCVSGCTVLTCSCTSAGFFWSSSSYPSNTAYAWYLYGPDGSIYASFRSNAGTVRAVRDGS